MHELWLSIKTHQTTLDVKKNILLPSTQITVSRLV
jgi:hypothetical protein